MSRTYRNPTYFMSKISLIKDFNEDLCHRSTFKSANHYAKVVMAKECSDSAIFRKTFLREVNGISPNGSPLGYRDWSRSRWAKQFANRARRIKDKVIVDLALIEMHEDILLDQEEAKNDCYYEEEKQYDEWLDDDWPVEEPFDDEIWYYEYPDPHEPSILDW